jgi:hypothetical protein
MVSKDGRLFAFHSRFCSQLALSRRLCRAGRAVVVYRVPESSMSAVFGRRSVRRAVLACVMAIAAVVPAQADVVTVAVDQARVMKLPAKVATIVIGNPLIADASLQRGGMLVVTGKGYGETNLLALDRDGHIVMDATLQVSAPDNERLVTVYKGIERESYSCTPECERRIMLGDAPSYFNAALAQSGSRNGSAQGGSGGQAR